MMVADSWKDYSRGFVCPLSSLLLTTSSLYTPLFSFNLDPPFFPPLRCEAVDAAAITTSHFLVINFDNRIMASHPSLRPGGFQKYRPYIVPDIGTPLPMPEANDGAKSSSPQDSQQGNQTPSEGASRGRITVIPRVTQHVAASNVQHC